MDNIMLNQFQMCRPCEAEKAAIEKQTKTPEVAALANKPLRKTWIIFGSGLSCSAIVLAFELCTKLVAILYGKCRIRKRRRVGVASNSTSARNALESIAPVHVSSYSLEVGRNENFENILRRIWIHIKISCLYATQYVVLKFWNPLH